MNHSLLPRNSLRPDECCNSALLERFVVDQIGVNAWPIHSRALTCHLRAHGLDVASARAFRLSRPALVTMMRFMYQAHRRAERLLRINNAFHCAMHNFEVFIRLLVLEWPQDRPMPDAVVRAPLRAYLTLDSVLPVALMVVDALEDEGVAGPVIARAALAALGHDYGHTGGTDRTDAAGRLLPLTHEEMAEKHVAGLGLRFGFPAALILESMAGIRATTFHHRPGRDRVQAANAFERRLTLADVMGCALPPDQWLTHVGLPVLLEKIPLWKRRSSEIEQEQRELAHGGSETCDDPISFAAIAARQQELVQEELGIIGDIAEWFRSERGFFVFIEANKLEAVPGARRLWESSVQQKIVLLEALLLKSELLEPLAALDGAFLNAFARQFANVTNLGSRLQQTDVDSRLRELLMPFVGGEVKNNSQRHESAVPSVPYAL